MRGYMTHRDVRRIPLTVAVVLAFAVGLAAEGMPPAKPEAVGISSERLRRLTSVMKQYVDDGRIAGVVTLVARGGRIAHLEAVGLADRESNLPMRTDTIFRIASMSKAVTSVAAMMLVEEGRLGLSDPVSRYIPGFKKTTVLVAPPPGAVPGTPVSAVPAKREINVRDLLTHTSGISYGSGAAEAQYKAANVFGWYFADKAEPVSAAIDRLTGLPFEAQPGEKYVYGFSTDVLGVVVEKASGLSLDEFFRTRIFEPLGMKDTHFYLPPEKKSRLAAVYAAKEGGGLERAPDAGTGQGAYVDGPRQGFSGGAGLLSTARDYARFMQALLDGGTLDGVRILSPKTVELMTSNHVGSLENEGRTGFGLGFEVVEHLGRAGRYGSVGEFGWGGAYYTSYWADPQEQLVALFMAQLLPSGGLDLQGKFRTLVYQSIVGPVPAAAARAAR
jgi:CubicO group peptidase (beta-lactamase class C family)